MAKKARHCFLQGHCNPERAISRGSVECQSIHAIQPSGFCEDFNKKEVEMHIDAPPTALIYFTMHLYFTS